MIRLEPYRNNPIGNIFLTRAKRDFSNGSIHIGKRLVEFGVYLAHCSIHSNDGVIPAEKRDGTYLISSDYHDEAFLADISGALQDAKEIINARGANALQSARKIHDVWLNKVYKQQLNDETMKIMFDLPPVVIKWDQHLQNRPVFANLWRIPTSTYAPVYDYLKMESFPPVYFVGDRPENDSKQYVEGIAEELDKSRREVLALSTAHEKIHLEITNPMSELCLPSIYHWWGEGVAITYADIDNYQHRNPDFYSPVNTLNTSEIMSPADGKFNFLGSVSTWLALCSVAAKSPDPEVIYQMSDKFISDMCSLAESGIQISPAEIPTKLASSVEPEKLLSLVDQQRLIILDMLSRGQF